jgi:hypothetical protein
MLIVMSQNVDLGKTQIADNVRVSSAAIFYEMWFGDYYQYETWIFSKDERIKSRMFIWGTGNGIEISNKMKLITETGHRRISKIMLKKFTQ